jgi:hypothetical protein
LNLQNKTLLSSPDVVSCDLEGVSALLDLRTGEYFSLNETGTYLWSLISQPIAYTEIVAKMLETYDVPEAQLVEDLNIIALEMSERKLILLDS